MIMCLDVFIILILTQIYKFITIPNCGMCLKLHAFTILTSDSAFITNHDYDINMINA